MSRKKQFSHPRLLSAQRPTQPPVPADGDEIFCSGVITTNITALLEWLAQQDLPVIEMPVDLWYSSYSRDECYVEAADLSRPILIAEIAPDYKDFIPDIPEDHWLSRGYSCIDGYHRLEKAKRLGIQTLPAIVLRMEQHIPFAYVGYDRYVEYWNRKLQERGADASRRK